jgi:hypothetical protein
MENNNAVCKKCKKQIPRSNLMLHEAQCKGEPLSNEPGKFDNDYIYCQKCDNYVQKQFLADHKLSHQYEENRQTSSIQMGSRMVDIVGQEPHTNEISSNLVNRNGMVY